MKWILRLLIGISSLYGSVILFHQGYHLVKTAIIAAPRDVVVAGNAGVEHIAFIMDGNRRWAKVRQLNPWEGHQSGVGPVKEAVSFCLDHGISVLSLYAFSLENFKRSREELQHLFNIVEKGLTPEDVAKLAQHGVRIRFIGDRAQFPPRLIDTISSIEKSTSDGKRLLVNILFCYGGRQELCSAVQNIARDVQRGSLRLQDLDEGTIASFLWCGDCSYPDMVVRSGGERRLSNCMPWQTTYSELFFVDTFWPAMTRADFEKLLVDYQARKRNFGG